MTLSDISYSYNCTLCDDTVVLLLYQQGSSKRMTVEFGIVHECVSIAVELYNVHGIQSECALCNDLTT